MMINQYSHSDECIIAACEHANKNKEKCKVLIGRSIKEKFLFKIIFTPSNRSFLLERKFYKLNDQCLGQLYFLILEKYGSIDEFINNHSKLITFL